MAIYAIGDLQGCYTDLRRLLKHIHFSSDRDQLWFAGDLVNRGPESLDCLNFVKDLGDNGQCVLGNHDLHLLAVMFGIRQPKSKDTLQAILSAPNREQLTEWLLQQPLLHWQTAINTAMLHAGLPPQWTLAEAKNAADEVAQVLQGDNPRAFFEHMYGNEPDHWQNSLTGFERLRFITNCFTRMRFADYEGHLNLDFKGAPKDAPLGLYPWYSLPHRQSLDTRIIFGHWSTLGAYHNEEFNIYALDSGCIWGGKLTALRIDGEQAEWFQHACTGFQKPG